MRALVTNCTRNSGLTVMQALAAAQWQVYGADDRILPFGMHSRAAQTAYATLPAENDPQFAAALLSVIERQRPDVLIPTRGIEAACKAREAIKQRTACLLPSAEAFEILNDKQRLLERCAALDIATPRVFELEDGSEFLRSKSDAQLVVKPRRDVGGGSGVHFISDSQALHALYRSVTAQYGDAVITEYIPGAVDAMRALHLLFDSSSRLIAFFILRKLRIWPAKIGVTVAAASTHEVQLVQQLAPLFSSVGWQGPADAEIKIDPRDGRAKVIEINPRFSGAIHFPIACGVNMPVLFCRAALGERLPEAHKPAYTEGVHYLDTTRWLAGLWAELRQSSGAGWRKVLRRAWSEELRHPRVDSVHTLRDLAPWMGKLLMRQR